jgi:NAD(P)-dependent dehydrogenase (short-subunit alcohol dehydrogenase family)
MMATEFALKGARVRVNAIAPGVYESEMTHDEITPDMVNKVGKGVMPVPAQRAGTCVHCLFLSWASCNHIFVCFSAQEMAGTVIYLASPAGCYTNGQVRFLRVLSAISVELCFRKL